MVRGEGDFPVGSKARYLSRHLVEVLAVRRNDFGKLVVLVRGYDHGLFESEVFADSLEPLRGGKK